MVATELKNLARQTAKATEEITGQVAAIQRATRSSVTAIQSTTNQRVNQIAAAAVEDQGAATREIARNVRQPRRVPRKFRATSAASRRPPARYSIRPRCWRACRTI